MPHMEPHAIGERPDLMLSRNGEHMDRRWTGDLSGYDALKSLGHGTNTYNRRRGDSRLDSDAFDARMAKVAAQYPEQASFLALCADRGHSDAAIRRKVAALASTSKAAAARWASFFDKLAEIPAPLPPRLPTPAVKPIGVPAGLEAAGRAADATTAAGGAVAHVAARAARGIGPALGNAYNWVSRKQTQVGDSLAGGFHAAGGAIKQTVGNIGQAAHDLTNPIGAMPTPGSAAYRAAAESPGRAGWKSMADEGQAQVAAGKNQMMTAANRALGGGTTPWAGGTSPSPIAANSARMAGNLDAMGQGGSARMERFGNKLTGVAGQAAPAAVVGAASGGLGLAGKGVQTLSMGTAAQAGLSGLSAPPASPHADPNEVGGGPAAVGPVGASPQPATSPQAPASAAPPMPGAAPAPQATADPASRGVPPATPGAPANASPPPLAAVDKETLASMTPEEAAQRGQMARQRAAAFPEAAKNMPPAQQQQEIQEIAKDAIASRVKTTGEDPAALWTKAQTGGWDQADLDDIMKGPAGPDLMAKAQQMGTDAYTAFTSMPKEQQLLAGLGLGIGFAGIASSLFGEGGLGSMLMTILGIGGAAAGMGLFSGKGSGPLGGIGEQYGLHQVGQLLGFGGQSGSGSPPPTAPTAPAAAPMPAAPPGGAPPAPAAAGSPSPQTHFQSIMSDGVVSPAEAGSVLASPATRQHLMTMPLDQRRQFVGAMSKGDPRFADQLAKAKWALGTKGTGMDLSGRAYAEGQRLGLQPAELDALAQAAP